jgi:hypothetical protein
MGSSGTAPAQQAQSPEFKPQYHHQKKRLNIVTMWSEGKWSNKMIIEILYIIAKRRKNNPNVYHPMNG